MTTPQRLAQFVQPTLPEARIAHQWAKIANTGRRQNRARARLVPAFAFTLLVCFAAAGGWHWYHSASPSALNGTAIESGASGRQSLTLPDDSQIELGPASRMVIDEYTDARVQLTLQKGKANFQVSHQPKRQFSIHAADLDIIVVGTRFTVDLGQSSELQRVTVQVLQGKVTVRNRHAAPDERVLAAGQSWTDGIAGPTQDLGKAADASASLSEPSDEGAAPEASAETELPGATLGRAAAATALPGTSAKSAAESPKELFELAETSRINGKLHDSADALNKLRRSYRSDPRAGLAAFELGRMRMDIFGDVSGSIDALRDAIQLSPGASFREDAESRLVQLYNRQGNRDACQSERAAYLSRFPHGAASKVVSRLCAP
jgi:transmembrane sensor